MESPFHFYSFPNKLNSSTLISRKYIFFTIQLSRLLVQPGSGAYYCIFDFEKTRIYENRNKKKPDSAYQSPITKVESTIFPAISQLITDIWAIQGVIPACVTPAGDIRQNPWQVFFKKF
jgi:hypothetical protein